MSVAHRQFWLTSYSSHPDSTALQDTAAFFHMLSTSSFSNTPTIWRWYRSTGSTIKSVDTKTTNKYRTFARLFFSLGRRHYLRLNAFWFTLKLYCGSHVSANSRSDSFQCVWFGVSTMKMTFKVRYGHEQKHLNTGKVYFPHRERTVRGPWEGSTMGFEHLPSHCRQSDWSWTRRDL